MTEFQCPICHSEIFQDFNGRKNAQCSECKSLERTRLMWMILKRANMLTSNLRILHIAPEKCLSEKFYTMYGDKYHPCDIEPEKYKNKAGRVFLIDLCRDAAIMPTGVFDLILHNHVLEHLPCDITVVIKNLNRLLAPGGLHLFSIPFGNEFTVEDLNPNLSGEERTRRFDQFDHMRLFGTKDFPVYLRNNFPNLLNLINLRDFFDEKDMLKANIPIQNLDTITGHSFFGNINNKRKKSWIKVIKDKFK